MSTPTLSRRSLFIGAGALGLTGLLASCTTGGGATGGSNPTGPGGVVLPDYIRYDGVAADIAGTEAGIPDVFLAYPADVSRAIEGAPGDGSAFTGSIPFNAAVAPLNDSNSYWVELRERLGMDVTLAMTIAADYPARFATAAAGNELGDFFNIPGNFNGLPQFLKSQAADLTPYLSGSAVADYPFLANLPTTSWRGTVYNEGIYALPISRGVQSSQILYTRGDLIDELGLDPNPASVDDFVELAGALTDSSANRWGLASVPMGLLQGMHEIPNNWGNDGGSLTSNYETPEFEDVLAIGAQLVERGYVHPDSLVTTPVNQKTWFYGGIVAMIADTYTASYGYCLNTTVGPQLRLDVAQLPGRMWLGSPNNSIAAIAKGDEERVRLMLEIANWLAAPLGTEEYQFLHFGQEGVDFEFENGEPKLTQTGNSQMGGVFPIEYLAAGPRPLYLPGFGDVSERLRTHMDAIIDDAVADPTYGLYSDTQSRQGGTLATRMADAITSVLAGREPVSSWKSTVADWRNAGGDRIRGEFEQALADS